MEVEKLVSKFKVLEFRVFGENTLPDRLYYGIAKMAIMQSRQNDSGWINRQLKLGRRNVMRTIGVEKGKGASDVYVFPTPAKLEIVLKVSDSDFKTKVIGSKTRVNFLASGYEFKGEFKNKTWNKLMSKCGDYDSWLMVVSGTLGEETSKGFVLEGLSAQVFERKPKR